MKYAFAGIVICVCFVYTVIVVRAAVAGKQSDKLEMFDIIVCSVVFLHLAVGFGILRLIWNWFKTLSILIW